MRSRRRYLTFELDLALGKRSFGFEIVQQIEEHLFEKN